MPNNFELHKKSIDSRAAAEKELQEAKEILLEAEAKKREAEDGYKRILEESKKDVNPELIKEAYEEYSGYLHSKVLEALQEKNYQEVNKISNELKDLKSNYGQPNMPQELLAGVEKFLKSRGITSSSEREHYLNRSVYLFQHDQTPEKIMQMLEREFLEVSQRQDIIPDNTKWTGGRK